MPLIPWRKRSVSEQPKELTPWESFRTGLERWMDEMERELLGSWGWPQASGAWLPPVDVTEDEKEVVVRAEVPGLRPEDLELSVTGNQLVLSGEKRESRQRQSGGIFQSECRFGKFYRTIELPTPVDADRIQAELADGVLTVRMPKTSAPAGRRIPIRAK
jgi:HSP20 family protein